MIGQNEMSKSNYKDNETGSQRTLLILQWFGIDCNDVTNDY